MSPGRAGKERNLGWLSSHLLAEVAQTVDHVVIIDRGRRVTAAPLADLATSAQPGVAVRTPDTARLRAALAAAGIAVDDNGPDRIVALGATPEAVGRPVADAGVVVYEMSLVGGS